MFKQHLIDHITHRSLTLSMIYSPDRSSSSSSTSSGRRRYFNVALIVNFATSTEYFMCHVRKFGYERQNRNVLRRWVKTTGDGANVNQVVVRSIL